MISNIDKYIFLILQYFQNFIIICTFRVSFTFMWENDADVYFDKEFLKFIYLLFLVSFYAQ